MTASIVGMVKPLLLHAIVKIIHKFYVSFCYLYTSDYFTQGSTMISISQVRKPRVRKHTFHVRSHQAKWPVKNTIILSVSTSCSVGKLAEQKNLEMLLIDINTRYVLKVTNVFERSDTCRYLLISLSE